LDAGPPGIKPASVVDVVVVIVVTVVTVDVVVLVDDVDEIDDEVVVARVVEVVLVADVLVVVDPMTVDEVVLELLVVELVLVDDELVDDVEVEVVVTVIEVFELLVELELLVDVEEELLVEELVLVEVVVLLDVVELVEVVVVGQPQVNVPESSTWSSIGTLSASETRTFSKSRETVSPRLQNGAGSVRRMVATSPDPGAIDSPPNETMRVLRPLSPGSNASHTKPVVRAAQSIWPNARSSGVSRRVNCSPRTSTSFSSKIGTSMSVALGSAHRSPGMLSVTVAPATPGTQERASVTSRMTRVTVVRSMTEWALNRVRVRKSIQTLDGAKGMGVFGHRTRRRTGRR
jgi:hypothetical protein